MKTFSLYLQSATQYEQVDGVASFVGEDASGGFGILAGRARLMTVLGYGLARYRAPEGAWKYVACPGAVLYFVDDRLFLNTRRYLHGTDYERIAEGLLDQLLAEEAQLRNIKENLARLEQELFRRLWQMGRERA